MPANAVLGWTEFFRADPVAVAGADVSGVRAQLRNTPELNGPEYVGKQNSSIII